MARVSGTFSRYSKGNVAVDAGAVVGGVGAAGFGGVVVGVDPANDGVLAVGVAHLRAAALESADVLGVAGDPAIRVGEGQQDDRVVEELLYLLLVTPEQRLGEPAAGLDGSPLVAV